MPLTELGGAPRQLHVRRAVLDGLVQLTGLEPGQALQTVQPLAQPEEKIAR